MSIRPILTPDNDGIDIIFYNPKTKFDHYEKKVIISDLDLESIISDLNSEEDYYIVFYSDSEENLACMSNCRIGYIDDNTLGIYYGTIFNFSLDEESEDYEKNTSIFSAYSIVEPIIRKAKIDSLLD